MSSAKDLRLWEEHKSSLEIACSISTDNIRWGVGLGCTASVPVFNIRLQILLEFVWLRTCHIKTRSVCAQGVDPIHLKDIYGGLLWRSWRYIQCSVYPSSYSKFWPLSLNHHNICVNVSCQTQHHSYLAHQAWDCPFSTWQAQQGGNYGCVHCKSSQYSGHSWCVAPFAVCRHAWSWQRWLFLPRVCTMDCWRPMCTQTLSGHWFREGLLLWEGVDVSSCQH